MLNQIFGEAEKSMELPKDITNHVSKLPPEETMAVVPLSVACTLFLHPRKISSTMNQNQMENELVSGFNVWENTS